MSEHQSTSADGRQASELVVIAASAGGVDALMALMKSLPADFPAPIVIAQHVDPHRPSHLAELLASKSAINVQSLTGRASLRRGTVYVVPADHDVEISDHHVGVRRNTSGASKPSADRLMTTAARVFGDNLIAVVLTGTGADGAAGAQAVKAYGGTVIVQNPKTAEFSGMPSAVPSAAVDIVADLDAIGPLLVDLLNGDYGLPRAHDEGDLSAFLSRVCEWSGLDFSAYKRPTIERRLQRRMAAAGIADLNEYQRYLKQNPDELQRLIASFLIKVTRFFRDPEMIDYLRSRILPRLIDEARGRGELRLWSAGCATGEEAYTLAMMVADLLGGDPARLSVRIFATDVAADAIAFARLGVYPDSAVADLPRELVERYFVQRDGSWEVSKAIRGMVIFGEHNLGHRAPFPRIDLILCRNVLIYFTPELQRRALQLFAFSLRPGGYLTLGKAESVSPLPEFFALEQPQFKVFRRIDGAAPIAVDRFLPPAGALGSVPMMPRATRDPAPQRTAGFQAHASPSWPTGQHIVGLLDHVSTGMAAVDRAYDIRFINLAGRRLLGIRGTAVGEDLVHGAMPAIAGPLRAALDAAFRGETSTVTVRVPRDVVAEEDRDLSITASPDREETGEGPVETVMIEAHDITGLTRRSGELEAERQRLAGERDELRDRADAEARELRTANESLVTEQSRLRVETEQLQVAHEEPQAEAEEIETLNEELQATVEELETLNEELQATVEEVNAANGELEARAIELESLTTTLDRQRRASETGRARLEAILATMSDAVLMVNAAGEAILTNTAWDAMLGPVDALRPEDESGHLIPAEQRPVARLLRDEAFTLTFTLPAGNDARRWFEASGQPIRGDDGAQRGILVVRDVTDRSLRRIQEQFLAAAAHEIRTPLTVLSGTLQLLARRLQRAPADDRVRELAARSLEQMRRLETQIAELMDMTRLQSGNMQLDLEPISLAAVIRSAVATARSLPAAERIALDLPESDVLVSGDAQRLEQVLLNLLTNAFTYAPESERIDVRLWAAGREAVIEVQDYGPGIPAEAQSHIFQRYFQVPGTHSAQHGLGLGLFICAEIVAAHQGTIALHSAAGHGATFEIRLPLLGEGPSEATGQEPRKDPDRGEE